MGGVGKTALALVLADRLKRQFPDGQPQIDLLGTSKNPLEPAKAMAQVIHSYLGDDARLPEDQNELRGRYRSMLSNKRALILLDNAVNRDQVEPLLPPSGCAVIITSRNKFALSGLEEIDLDVLPLDDSKKLLLEIAEHIGGQAKELAKLCGCLPTALRNAAYALKERRNLDVAEYVDRLKDARNRVELVKASFSLSYDLLPPYLQSIWSMLSIFPAGFDRTGAAAVLDQDSDAAAKALEDLLKWSLLNFNPSNERYHLHDLARDYASTRLETETKNGAQQRHARYYQLLLGRANDLYLNGGEKFLSGLKLFDIERMNIEQGQNWSKMNFDKNHENATICSNFALSGNILHLRLHPREYIEWLKAALKSARQMKDQKIKADHLRNLGIAYRNLSRFDKAIALSKRSLAIAEDGNDQMQLGKALVELGNVYFNKDVYNEAIAYYENALEVSKKLGDRRLEGDALRGLGITYRNIGCAQKSINYQKQNLEIARELGDRVNEGIALGNLGRAYNNLGEPDKGKKCHKMQLEITRDPEVGDRRGEGRALTNLGYTYAVLNEIPDAIKSNKDALAVLREIGDELWQSNALCNLGFTYIQSGDLQKAIKCLEQSRDKSTKINDRRGRGNALKNLGIAYAKLGDIEEAIKLYDQRLTIARDIMDRRGEANTLFYRGEALEKSGKQSEAIEQATLALKIFKKIESPTAEEVRQKLAEWQK